MEYLAIDTYATLTSGIHDVQADVHDIELRQVRHRQATETVVDRRPGHPADIVRARVWPILSGFVEI